MYGGFYNGRISFGEENIKNERPLKLGHNYREDITGVVVL
jgi:hypothetical protein